jgi:hypothetical protein
VFAHEPEKKRQTSVWFGETSPQPKELKFQISRIKTKLINFFDSQGAGHKEFPQLKIKLEGLPLEMLLRSKKP